MEGISSKMYGYIMLIGNCYVLFIVYSLNIENYWDEEKMRLIGIEGTITLQQHGYYLKPANPHSNLYALVKYILNQNFYPCTSVRLHHYPQQS